MATVEQLMAELRGFKDRKVVLKELRAGIRNPFPEVRKRIKKNALATLPKSGGLNKWVAKSRITLRVKFSGSSVGVTVVGGRNSQGGETDLKRLDRGTTRHPSWGRRGSGQWHTQKVTAGFFTKPVEEAQEWFDAIDAATDKAFDQIRRG